MLRTDLADGVLTVTLARPERRNAIDGEMAAALREAFEAAADDPEVRALILTGEGKAFSAGGDLSRFERDWDPREFRHDSHPADVARSRCWSGWRSRPWPRSTAP